MKKVKKICLPMFLAALFTINKRWKHHKCPSTDEQTTEYFPVLKKKERNPDTCYKIDDSWAQSEVDHSQKDKYYMTEIIWGT